MNFMQSISAKAVKDVWIFYFTIPCCKLTYFRVIWASCLKWTYYINDLVITDSYSPHWYEPYVFRTHTHSHMCVLDIWWSRFFLYTKRWDIINVVYYRYMYIIIHTIFLCRIILTILFEKLDNYNFISNLVIYMDSLDIRPDSANIPALSIYQK